MIFIGRMTVLGRGLVFQPVLATLSYTQTCTYNRGETDRQTERQADRQTDGQTDRDRETVRHRETETETETERDRNEESVIRVSIRAG